MAVLALQVQKDSAPLFLGILVWIDRSLFQTSVIAFLPPVIHMSAHTLAVRIVAFGIALSVSDTPSPSGNTLLVVAAALESVGISPLIHEVAFVLLRWYAPSYSRCALELTSV